MKKRHSLGVLMDKAYVKAKYSYKTFLNVKYAHKRIKIIGGGYKGSAKEYRDVVLSYWKKYGKRPARYWYTLLCNGKDAYDPRYIPDSMYYNDVLPYFNNLMMRRAYVDKGMYNILLPNVKKPETVVKNIAGYFYDGDGHRPITREEAIARCAKEEHLIFKASLDSGGGRSILFYDAAEMDASTIEKYFEEYQGNYVAQRLVKQHPDLARIHEQSLNTIRVQSLHFKDQVYILSAQLRMGAGGSKVDNISAGGMSCPIKPDGWLEERSVTRKSEWRYEHPSGIKFKDIRVPNYDKIIETIKRLHPQIPYFNLIGWDFSVDAEGDPVFIEMNVSPEPNQIASGPTFGDITDEVLEDIFITKSLMGKTN